MAEETTAEKLARIRLERGIEVLPESEIDPVTGLTMSDRAKPRCNLPKCLGW